MNLIKREWNIVKAFTVCIAISLAVILFGIAALCINGLPLGIEFAGGVELTVDFDENDVSQSQYETIKAELRDYLETCGVFEKFSQTDIMRLDNVYSALGHNVVTFTIEAKLKEPFEK